MKTRCYVGNIAAAQNVKKKEILRRRIEEQQQNQKKTIKTRLLILQCLIRHPCC